MVVLAVLSIALVPLAVHLIGSFFGRTYVVSPATIAIVMSTSIFLPLLIGMVTRVVAASFASKISMSVERAGKVLMPLAVAVLVIAAASDVWRLVGNGTLIAITVFVSAGFAVGHVLGGPEPEHSAVLAFFGRLPPSWHRAGCRRGELPRSELEGRPS